MLIPKKVKHRKWMKGRRRVSVDSRGTTLSFGSYGLQVISGSEWITSRQIEAARRTMTRYIKRGGKVWIRIFPDRPFTRKAAEVGMGKGKGDPVGYECIVRPGRIIFEIDGVSDSMAREALRKAAAKLPIKGIVVTREN